MIKSESNLKKSKPWNRNSSHNSFRSADAARNKLLDRWSDNPDEFVGMQIKVRRMSGGVYIVKTRLHPDFDRPPKEKKVRGKDSRRNKKNSSQGKFNTPRSV
mgnify:CR=1 FL=1